MTQKVQFETRTYSVNPVHRGEHGIVEVWVGNEIIMVYDIVVKFASNDKGILSEKIYSSKLSSALGGGEKLYALQQRPIVL